MRLIFLGSMQDFSASTVVALGAYRNLNLLPLSMVVTITPGDLKLS